MEFFGIKNLKESNHINIIFFGIKLHILKPDMAKARKNDIEYYKKYQNPQDVPVAEGNLRLIQLSNAKLLKVFDDFCRKYELNYWIDFGTLLGAVRHKGFIPWDDDVDIGMPRNDYEKLFELKRQGVFDSIDIDLKLKNNCRNKCFVKLVHKKYKQLFVDIFPYDFYSSKLDDEGKVLLSEKIKCGIKPSLFRYIKSEEGIRNYFKKYTKEKLLCGQEVNLENKPAIFMSIDFPHRWANKVYDWETIFPINTIKFEQYEFKCPNQPDKVLKSIYGDYMAMPKDLYARHSNKEALSEEEIESMNKFIRGEV